MKPKIYKTTEDMIQDQEIMRKEVLQELLMTNVEIQKNRRRKIKIIMIVILSTLVLFKIFVGELNITLNNNGLFSFYKNRLYIVELNNSPITVGVEEYKSITIIPFVLKLNIFSNHVYYQNDYNMYIKYELGATIDLDIQAYKCYNTRNNKRILATCVGNTKNLLKKEINDVEYTLLIKETRRGERIAYSGEFIEDISSYFSDKGQYLVRITGIYNNIESAIYFWIEIV